MQGLTKLGWVEGRNIEIEYRFAAGSPGKMLANAAELASLKPEVILVNGAPALAALTKATKSIPIVFVAVSDPVDASSKRYRSGCGPIQSASKQLIGTERR
jgi:ABC-type uncharacterized transport system substrate-binding protein